MATPTSPPFAAPERRTTSAALTILMWIKNISAVTETVYRNINESKIIKTDNNKYLIDENICKQLNNIIDEIFADLPLQDLDDIDNSVSVLTQTFFV